MKEICAEFILKIKLFSRDGKDQGANVRERAKQLVALLKDDERLRAEREKSLKNKERFSKTTTEFETLAQHLTLTPTSDSTPTS